MRKITIVGAGRVGETTAQILAEKELCQEIDCPFGDDWYTGDNVNLSIGQGEVAVTPLQLANAYSTLANGGTRFSPNIVLEVRESNSEVAIRTLGARVSGEVPLPAEVRQPILDGLVGVTTDSRGTGVGVFAGFPHDLYPVAGKTGTAQVNDKADTSVFTGFGPVFDPQYTVTAILEESGFGATFVLRLPRRAPGSNPTYEHAVAGAVGRES